MHPRSVFMGFRFHHAAFVVTAHSGDFIFVFVSFSSSPPSTSTMPYNEQVITQHFPQDREAHPDEYQNG
jgi:hypothetical protein